MRKNPPHRNIHAVSMFPEYRFPLKRKYGFLHIGTPVSDFRNWGVKPPGILIRIFLMVLHYSQDVFQIAEGI